MIETCRVNPHSNHSYSSRLTYYTNLVVEELFGAAEMWQTATIELVTKVLVRFPDMAEQGVVGFQISAPRIGYGRCKYLSRFCLLFAVTSIITVFLLSSSAALLIPPLQIWLIVAQSKSTGCLLMVHTVGYHAALPTGVYMAGLKLWLMHGKNIPVGCLVWIDCMSFGLLHGWYLLLISAACGSLQHICICLLELISKRLIAMLFPWVSLMYKTLT